MSSIESSIKLSGNRFVNAGSAAADGMRFRSTLEDQIISGFARVTDIVLLLALSILIAHLPMRDSTPWGQTVLLSAIALVAATTALNASNSYSVDALRSFRRQLRRASLGLVLGAAAGSGAAMLLGFDLAQAASWGEAWLLCAAIVVAVTRLGWGLAIERWVTHGRLVRHVAVVGSGEQAFAVAKRIGRDQRHRMRCVGLYSDDLSLNTAVFPAEGGLDDLIQRSRRERVDAILLSMPTDDPERVRSVLDRLSSTIADIQILPQVEAFSGRPLRMARLGSDTLLTIGERPHKAWDGVQKAVFDRVFAALLLLALSPLLLLVAMLIRLDSPGPILFRQPRVGFNNRLFHIRKFRSMYTNMSDLHASRQTSRDDPRVTAVGRWIRKLSIDELPQILNVLRGEMSLVGPRPHALNTRAEERHLDEIVENYACRHRVLPGITGWAQVNGFRGELRTAEQVRGRVKHDLYYIDNWSFGLDLRIMLLTLVREIRSRSAF